LRPGRPLVLLWIEGRGHDILPSGGDLLPDTRQNASGTGQTGAGTFVTSLRDNAGVSAFVGRAEPSSRLDRAYRTLTGPDAAGARRPGLALVTGEAGIGKTALLTRFAAAVAARGAMVVWGTCWDDDQAPAWWPWTQAVRALLDQREGLDADLPAAMAAVVPEAVGTAPPDPTGSFPAGRLGVFDATGRWLADVVRSGPVVIILDDLQWADLSTVDLMRFLTRQTRPGPLMLVGAYRPGEAGPEVAAALADLATGADIVALAGLTPEEVTELVDTVAGPVARPDWARLVHERTGGHPFFARELCHLLATGGNAGDVPAAVRGAIGRRLARLSDPCVGLLGAAAVAGADLLPDVLADALSDEGGAAPTAIAELISEAAAAGILTYASGPTEPARFTHDLYRQTIYADLPAGRRLDLHHRVAAALAARRERGSPVFAAELARHFAAAVPRGGAAPAMRWARAAADADMARYAFDEAAAHLARARSAIADAGLDLPGADLVDLLVAEANLRLRAGDSARARALLDPAWTRAVALGDGGLLGTVALGLDQVGARFAMPRTDLIRTLDAARSALVGSGTPTEAQVTAALARQLQHSVPADRPRARPLADEAVAIARHLDDPATLASCLLAQHDTRWVAGTATDRATICAEIADLALRAGDPERHAQALLLAASAHLENSSAAFRAVFSEYAYVTEQLRQPRHDYLLRTRLAALALLDGDLDTGERLSAEAVALGDAVGETDTGNVRMSQRLEIVRVRNDASELREMAAEAVRWWVGAPVHAHAVAAGFLARAGDLDAARTEVDTVVALDAWRTDRTYLWSVYIGELAAAAIALSDRPLCQSVLDALLPAADTCAVNGALVCFMGSHAHRVGLLYGALGRRDEADRWLRRALEIHRRLGARTWEAETVTALARLDDADPPGRPDRPGHPGRPDRSEDGSAGARLQRVGDMWQASYRGRVAYLRDAKGLHDLAALLDRPGVDVPALDLAAPGETVVEPATSDAAVLDRTALTAYRRRLAELDDELAVANATADLGRRTRASEEREHLLTQLRRATRPGGRLRPLGTPAAERARKAVTARIRDAIRHIAAVLPDLGTHLDRTVRTGTTCRYDPPEA
jgi:hypothetical protein